MDKGLGACVLTAARGTARPNPSDHGSRPPLGLLQDPDDLFGDTAAPDGTAETSWRSGQVYSLQERSLVLLRQHIDWDAQESV